MRTRHVALLATVSTVILVCVPAVYFIGGILVRAQRAGLAPNDAMQRDGTLYHLVAGVALFTLLLAAALVCYRALRRLAIAERRIAWSSARIFTAAEAVERSCTVLAHQLEMLAEEASQEGLANKMAVESFRAMSKMVFDTCTLWIRDSVYEIARDCPEIKNILDVAIELKRFFRERVFDCLNSEANPREAIARVAENARGLLYEVIRLQDAAAKIKRAHTIEKLGEKTQTT